MTVRQRFGLGSDAGVLVTDVTPGSPAAQAGLRAGDVITSLAGDRIASVDDLTRAVHKRKAGDKVERQWRRGTQGLRATATLAPAPGGH